jgi:methionine synthase II (cobalamin-independent)
VVASHVRYQACFPTPIAVVGAFVPADDQASFEPRYEEAVVGEVQAICNDIPHQDLAVQWDVAVETAMLEGAMEHWFRDDTVFDELIARLVRLGNAIPEDVQLGYHLCYGYYERKHFLEPKDLGLLTRMANAIQAGLHRRLDFVQMPVPVSRDDEEYFAPLAGLDLGGELYLGVVHHDDGVAGAERRIAAAKAVVGDRLTGVATECGMGQYPPEWLGKLLEIHAEVRV